MKKMRLEQTAEELCKNTLGLLDTFDARINKRHPVRDSMARKKLPFSSSQRAARWPIVVRVDLITGCCGFPKEIP